MPSLNDPELPRYSKGALKRTKYANEVSKEFAYGRFREDLIQGPEDSAIEYASGDEIIVIERDHFVEKTS
jgi:hypothetical protein